MFALFFPSTRRSKASILAEQRSALELTMSSTSSDSASLGLSVLFPSALGSNNLAKANAKAAIAACFLVAAFFFKRSFCFLYRSEELNDGDSNFPGGGGLRESSSSSLASSSSCNSSSCTFLSGNPPSGTNGIPKGYILNRGSSKTLLLSSSALSTFCVFLGNLASRLGGSFLLFDERGRESSTLLLEVSAFVSSAFVLPKSARESSAVVLAKSVVVSDEVAEGSHWPWLERNR
jgi:hypothetical protein